VATSTRTRTSAVDSVLAEAVELARAAAEQDAGGPVGEHLGVEVDDDRVLTHSFVTLDPAYRGWRWAVTLTRAARSRDVTVDEVVLLPGSSSIVSPEWVPWSERLQPGDLRVGDVLPAPAGDERLVPSAFAATEPDDVDVIGELGLGRARVLSRYGRDEAATRWHEGDRGPHAEIARAAPATCSSCGFYVLLAGALHAVFGVCANEYAPDDGRVVSADHGCGAHSESIGAAELRAGPPVLDEFGYDPVEHR
jgi:hypothetical protein